MSSDRRDKPPGVEEVGYRNPPRRTRFKRGQSGNPKGRPRGSRNFRSDVKSTLNTLVKVQDSMSSLRVKGYCLPYSYGFVGLKCQLTDRTLQRFVFLIERIHFLQKAVGIAHVSRTLCLSREVECVTHNETVSDAS